MKREAPDDAKPKKKKKKKEGLVLETDSSEEDSKKPPARKIKTEDRKSAVKVVKVKTEPKSDPGSDIDFQ